ncbi:Uncharacterized protein dnl_56140 [Desulfonema limicola]|uniref:Uncharacterized protein n=1 Tax=Desulfonema limicola TaxID=45656 RepID=A0A975GJQ8_9BACT|nr:Uncharacterized protein dnl_56140 [Desulfonema limicola]
MFFLLLNTICLIIFTINFGQKNKETDFHKKCSLHPKN